MTTRRHPAAVARQRILEEAEHLIHLHGYRCTSLDEIAARCKMTKANLFHHFRSKEDLALAVLDYKADCYRRNCLDRVFAPGGDPVEAVDRLFTEAASFHRGNGCKAGCFVGNIALEMSDVSAAFRERAAAFFEEWASRLTGLLAGDRAAAESVLALYEGAIMLARTRRDPDVFIRARTAALRLIAPRTGDDFKRAAKPPARSMKRTQIQRR